MDRIRRLVADKTYYEFTKKILNDNKDTLSNDLIGDVGLIKEALLNYDVENLKLIKVHTSSLKEGVTHNQLIAAMLGFGLGLIPYMVNLLFFYVNNGQFDTKDKVFTILIFVFLTIFLTITIIFTKRISSIALVNELTDLCIKEIEEKQNKKKPINEGV